MSLGKLSKLLVFGKPGTLLQHSVFLLSRSVEEYVLGPWGGRLLYPLIAGIWGIGESSKLFGGFALPSF